MLENSKKNSRLYRLLFISPWLPLIFIGLLAFSIYADHKHLAIPSFIRSPWDLIIFNNVCFVLVIAIRFVSQLARLNRKFRYEYGGRPHTPSGQSSASLESVRARFTKVGYYFDKNGYGEKRTLSLPATTIIYGGILLALLVGSYDNMRQFSGVFVQGVGLPLPLDVADNYLNVFMGPLSTLKDMPKFQVRNLILDDAKWPKGAVEIALYENGKGNAVVAHGMVAMDGQPLIYSGLEYHLGQILLKVPLQILADKGYKEFDDTLIVQPLDPPQGNYTYYSSFTGASLRWDLLYDPARKAFRLLGGMSGHNIVDGVLQFGRDNAKQMGAFTVMVPVYSQRAEIHVVRHRHMALIILGIGITVIGVVMRLLFRPQRVWLEEIPGGCRAWGCGGEVKRLMKAGE
jgi:hypothetical protein